MNRKHGFSLVELLVVIAIIAVLAALLMPVMQNVRQRGETLTCASNLRSLGSALILYAEDNSGRFPYRQDWSVESWHFWGWADARGPEILHKGKLWPYINDEPTYLCPTFAKVYGFNPAAAHLTPVRSYTMNEYFTFADGGPEMNSTRAWRGMLNMIRPRIEKPASLGMIGEENTWLTPYSRWIINNSCLGVGEWRGDANGLGEPTENTVDAIGSFHNPIDGDMRNGSSNVAFADGHVSLHHITESKKIFTPERVKQGRGDP